MVIVPMPDIQVARPRSVTHGDSQQCSSTQLGRKRVSSVLDSCWKGRKATQMAVIDGYKRRWEADEKRFFTLQQEEDRDGRLVH